MFGTDIQPVGAEQAVFREQQEWAKREQGARVNPWMDNDVEEI
jgi:hypothetical protein